MFKKTYMATKLARWFINRVDRDAGEGITHLKLHKLLYYAQSWSLANFNKPLFREDMQAWRHGPVIPSVWHQYKGYKWDTIPPSNTKVTFDDERIEKYLDIIYEKYGKYSAKELERMTHADAPWRVTRGDLPLEASCTTAIDKNLIRDFYAKKIKKKWH